ncbi:MAG: hypothetical protein M3041_05165 [Acidobacteriota bacterium]|nr:hypothetical protein [Acidobacteriota bacterium]
MKRLVLALLFAIVPTALLAQVADRDVLLTPDGTLYMIESTDNDGAQAASVQSFLTLTIQRGSERTVTTVPESLSGGMHWRPALTYDTDSKTLFVFWLKMPNPFSSELLLASYANGHWQPAVSIDNQPYHLRFNLRIGVTTRISQLQNNGAFADAPALLVHAVWWEETGYGEAARYGLFSVDKGRISFVELHDLTDFTGSVPIFPTDVDPKFNAEILKHPALIDNGTANSVDVIFGDKNYAVFNRVTLKPIADGRIHIPIGARPGGPRIAAPKSFTDPWTGRISTITSPRSGNLLLYNTTKDSVSYVMFSSGSWSSVKTLALSEKFSAEAAVGALSRMMNQ